MKSFIIILSVFFLSGITLKSQVTFTKIITGNRFEIAKSVIPTRDGGYAFLADFRSGTNTGKWIVKTDANGDTLWTRAFRNQGGIGKISPYALSPTSDKGYLAAARIMAGSTGLMQISLLDSSGATVRTKMFDLVSPGFIARTAVA